MIFLAGAANVSVKPILPLGPILVPCKHQVKYLDKYDGNCSKEGN